MDRAAGFLLPLSADERQLDPEGSGTRLTFTEQVAFLDGYDDIGSRGHGTRLLPDALGTRARRGGQGVMECR